MSLDEKRILNIKKLKVECKKCKTQLILALGDTPYQCPVCGSVFVSSSYDHFKELASILQSLATHSTADFSFVCDDKEIV